MRGKQQFSPPASLFEMAETFRLKVFKSNSARGHAQHRKLQSETKKKLTEDRKNKTRVSQCELSLVKGGAVAPTIIKLVPHFPLSYFPFVLPFKHIINRKKKKPSPTQRVFHSPPVSFRQPHPQLENSISKVGCYLTMSNRTATLFLIRCAQAQLSPPCTEGKYYYSL